MAEINHLLYIKSSDIKIYNAITQEAGLKGWWTYGTKLNESEVGSVITFDFEEKYHNEMKIVKLDQNIHVEWICLEGDHEWVGTHFIFDIEDKGEDSILRFKHSHWKEATDFFASCNYHWGFYLRSLKLYCETGKGTPFPQER